MVAHVVRKSTGGGRPPKVGQAVRKATGGIRLRESTRGKEPGRQPATKAGDRTSAMMTRKSSASQEPGVKVATATKAADRKPAKMARKPSGSQEPGVKIAPATKAADRKPAKMAPKPSGSQEPGVKAARPTYWVMVKEAISSLKQRRGSSQQAVAKYLDENYGEDLPENFKKTLSSRLKEWSKADGKLTKVKNSYKLVQMSKGE